MAPKTSSAAVARIAYLSSSAVVSVLPASSAPSSFAATYSALQSSTSTAARPLVESSHARADPAENLARHAATAAADEAEQPIVSLTAPADPIFLTRLIPHAAALRSAPAVLHVAVEQGGDLADVLALRSSGLAVLFSATLAEAHDHALIASKLAKKTRSGVLHVFEEAEGELAELTENELREYLVAERAIPKANGNGVNGAAAEDVPELAKAFDRVALATVLVARRPQRPFTYAGPTSPDNLLITFGSASAALLAHAPSTANTGVLAVHLYRPFVPSRLLDLVPASVKKVAVLEQVSKKITRFAPLFLDVVSAFAAAEGREAPVFVSGVLGAVDEASAPKAVQAVLANLAAAEPQHGQVVGELSSAAKASLDVHVPKHEGAYTKLLEEIFGDRLAVVNSPSLVPTEGPEATTPEFAFGSTLAAFERREAAVAAVSELVSAQGATSNELHDALAKWLIGRDDAKTGGKLGAVLLELLEKEKPAHSAAARILENRDTLAPQSRWIIGSDAWSYDVGFSGLHHVVSSGKNVNVLVIDSLPYSQREAQDPAKRKKDVGLYAMNHGDVYVASVAVYASYTQVLHALIEADKFQGPSVVIAYLPYTSEASPALEILKETKTAVDSGYWPLYRWDPSQKKDEDVFKLDSERIKADLREFLDRQNHLSNLVRAQPELAPALVGSEGHGLKAAQKRKAKEAFDALLGALDGPPLLVLFASDGGNAEKVAKRVAARAKTRGLAARLLAMDDFPFEDLKLEKHVAFITSTAGQGEPPQNARETFKTIAAELAKPEAGALLADVNYTVFGMGDSHYWPRPEDAHYYNKPSKDLDARLEHLGASRMADLGLGDDQDPDGAETGYKAWEPKLWKALGVDNVEITEKEPEPITNEHIKIASNYLRGTIADGLKDTSTGALAESDGQLTKFHGIYQQDDRDIREERKAQGLEPAYSFMVRIRMPGGVCDGKQWLAIDRIADEHGNSTFKITTRQTFQFHGVVKKHLKPTIQDINKVALDTIAACGDVNRNVLCSANPQLSQVHAEVYDFAKRLSEHLLPKTSAYREIWLDGKQVAGEAVKDFEPLYGKYYLPRKFKMAVAVPPHNDVDIFTNDVGFIAIVDEKTGKLDGFNVSIGGGMGVTHSNKKTYPRLADVIGFIKPDEALNVAEKIMTVQRDYGNRANRKNARLKYTIDNLTLPVFVDHVEKRLGYKLAPAKPFKFDSSIDQYGWKQGHDGKWHFTTFIENGRVQDEPGMPYKTGLREVARIHKGKFRLTANQHLIVADVAPEDLDAIKAVLEKYKLDNLAHSGLRLSSSACVAFPTCGLAMAESERYLPLLVGKVEKIMEDAGLRNDQIVMRMTGCPNGCARPWVAEIAFVGRAPGTYMMMLGGGFHGERLSKPYRESVTEPEIIEILTPMIKAYALERLEGEHFGDFVIRKGWISATDKGANFYINAYPSPAPIAAA